LHPLDAYAKERPDIVQREVRLILDGPTAATMPPDIARWPGPRFHDRFAIEPDA